MVIITEKVEQQNNQDNRSETEDQQNEYHADGHFIKCSSGEGGQGWTSSSYVMMMMMMMMGNWSVQNHHKSSESCIQPMLVNMTIHSMIYFLSTDNNWLTDVNMPSLSSSSTEITNLPYLSTPNTPRPACLQPAASAVSRRTAGFPPSPALLQTPCERRRQEEQRVMKMCRTVTRNTHTHGHITKHKQLKDDDIDCDAEVSATEKPSLC